MAYTLSASTDQVFSLEQYIDYVSTKVDVNDEACVLESAWALKALANNRTFIAEALNQELASWQSFQANNRYTPQTMMLGRGRGFFVRANIWEPPDEAVRSEEHNRLFAYKVPHDHNFSFMTAGYLGSGYETSIYEYDRDATDGRPGTHAGLRFLEHTALPQGKVMMYRACKDVHIQEHSSEFSISLNLMLQPPTLLDKDQYYFNIEEDRLDDFVPNSSTGRTMLCRIARHVGDDRTSELLDQIGQYHSARRVRALALESLAELRPEMRAYVMRVASADCDPLVRTIARQLDSK